MVHPAGKPRDEAGRVRDPGAAASEAWDRQLAFMAHQMIALGHVTLFMLALVALVRAWEHDWSKLILLILPLGMALGAVRWLKQCFGPLTRVRQRRKP